MGAVADQLDAVEVRVFSPDGNIKGRLAGGNEVDIRFKSDEYYRSVPAESLGHQLGRVLTLLAVGRIRQRHEILEAADFEVYSDRKPHWDARVRRFHEKRAQVKAMAHSPRKHIAIATLGLREFKVRFDSGLTRKLDKAEFVSEFQGAVSALVSAYSEQMSELKTAMDA